MIRDALTDVIADGRRRDLSDEAIADAILASVSADPTWAKALSHPSRAEILRILGREGTISPVHAARELGQTVGSTAYHFRQLHQLGVIEIAQRIQRRGATEHVYRLTRSATSPKRPARR